MTNRYKFALASLLVLLLAACAEDKSADVQDMDASMSKGFDSAKQKTADVTNQLIEQGGEMLEGAGDTALQAGAEALQSGAGVTDALKAAGSAVLEDATSTDQTMGDAEQVVDEAQEAAEQSGSGSLDMSKLEEDARSLANEKLN